MNQHSDVTNLKSGICTTLRSPEQLRNLLNAYSGLAGHLTLTHNRVSMVSVRFDFLGNPRLRLSKEFLSAPDDVLAALGHYLKTRSSASWRKVCAFVSSREPGGGEPRRVVVRTAGQVFDLAGVLARVNRLYFDEPLDCRIGWAKAGQQRQSARTRTIRYGTYNKALNLIRINPILDNSRVPAEFMDYIVFHELLHAAVPSQRGRGRWRHHHGSYRILERRFPDHARMQKLAADLVMIL